jgi:hypothetical protein
MLQATADINIGFTQWPTARLTKMTNYQMSIVIITDLLLNR